jgi:iron complex transport system substrate-binding protein
VSRFITLIMAGAILFGAAGCGTTTDDQPAETGSTRSVEFGDRTAEVPVDPQRVVALGEEFLLADLLDLGIEPVASTATLGNEFSGLDEAKTEGIETLDVALLDLDRVAALDPDLLLVDEFVLGQAGYDRLTKIAPTVAFESDDWRENYELLGRTLGEEKLTGERLAEYDSAVDAAKAGIDPDLTASVMTAYPTEVVAWTADSPATVPSVIDALGVELSPTPGSGLGAIDSGRISISLEKIDLLQGDGLIQLQSSAVAGEDASLRRIEDSPIYQGLPAIEADQSARLDRLAWPGVTGRIEAAHELGDLLSGWKPTSD